MSRIKLASVWPPTAVVSGEAVHRPQSPLRAIRAKCLDCSCYQMNEIQGLRGHPLCAVALPGS